MNHRSLLFLAALCGCCPSSEPVPGPFTSPLGLMPGNAKRAAPEMPIIFECSEGIAPGLLGAVRVAVDRSLISSVRPATIPVTLSIVLTGSRDEMMANGERGGGSSTIVGRRSSTESRDAAGDEPLTLEFPRSLDTEHLPPDSPAAGKIVTVTVTPEKPWGQVTSQEDVAVSFGLKP